MNGILFGDLLVKLLGTSFVCYSVPFYIDQILFMEKTDNRDVEKKQTKKLTLKDIITLLVMIIVIIALVWGIMYWIVDRRDLLGAGIILLVSFLYCGIAMPVGF